MLANGYKLRNDNNIELIAWHACNIMNVHLKRKITIKKLLGKEKTMDKLTLEKEREKLNIALSKLKERN